MGKIRTDWETIGQVAQIFSGGSLEAGRRAQRMSREVVPIRQYSRVECEFNLWRDFYRLLSPKIPALRRGDHERLLARELRRVGAHVMNLSRAVKRVEEKRFQSALYRLRNGYRLLASLADSAVEAGKLYAVPGDVEETKLVGRAFANLSASLAKALKRSTGRPEIFVLALVLLGGFSAVGIQISQN